MAGANISTTEGAFNPALPPVTEDTKPERMLGFAKSITQPESSKVGAYIGQAAESLAAPIHALANAKELFLDQEMREGIREIKEKQIANLDRTGLFLRSGLQVSADKPLPDELKNLPATLTAFKDLRANGHFSNTQMDMELRTYLSGIRNRNPNWVDYVDDQGKKIIGYDPANAEIQQRVQDLNALNANKKKTGSEWVIHQILEKPQYSQDANMRALIEQAPKLGETEVYSKFFDLKSKIDKLHVDSENAKNAVALDKDEQGPKVDQLAQSTFNTKFHSASILGGAYHAEDVLKALQGGEFNRYKPEEWRRISMGLDILYQDAMTNLREQGNAPVTTRDGRISTNRQILGSEEYERRVQEAGKPWKSYVDMIRNGEYGPAFVVQRVIKDIQDNAAQGLLTMKDQGEILANLEWARKNLPPEMVEPITSKYLASTRPGQLAAYALKEDLNIIAGNKTIQEVIEDSFKNGVKNRRQFVDLVGVVKQGDPSDPRVQKVMNMFVDPKNAGLIDQFQKDYYDQHLLKEIPGKYAAFWQLTTPEVAAQFAKAPADIKQRYMDRVSQWMGKLFDSDAADLASIQGIHWDADNHRVLYDAPRQSPATVRDVGNDANIRRLVNRLNTGLQQYEGVVKSQHPNADINKEVLQVLEDMGFTPGKPRDGVLKGFINSILDSLKKPPKKTMEDQ